MNEFKRILYNRYVQDRCVTLRVPLCRFWRWLFDRTLRKILQSTRTMGDLNDLHRAYKKGHTFTMQETFPEQPRSNSITLPVAREVVPNLWKIVLPIPLGF